MSKLTKLTFNTVRNEICKREKSDHREANITDVKRVMKHYFDIAVDADRQWREDGRKQTIAPSLCFHMDEMEKRSRKSKSRASGSKVGGGEVRGMCLPDYYRDIWCLSPSSNGYPGAFPRGFVRRVLAKWNGKNRLWFFSGSYRPEKDLFANDTTVDIKPELEPDVVADCAALPFEDNSFDFVLADPPYSEAESLELYDLPYVSIVKTLNEMWRVCQPEGFIVLLHRLVPMRHPEFTTRFSTGDVRGIVGVFTITGMSNMRALTVWQKLLQEPKP